jgi:KDO2-lipid IV(A) lauroyltransferase
LFLTGHLGAWELSAFAHSLQGHPLSIVMRSLDNPYVDALIQRYRTMHGNRTVDKDDFVRGLLQAMRAGQTVGILMDTNMTPPQGVFVDFFGIPACTASGLARIALRTNAAANTAKFTKIIEAFVRRYPDQWLWVHRRWKTRPEGQPPLY